MAAISGPPAPVSRRAPGAGSLGVQASRERRQFVSHNAIAAGGTLLAGILGLLLQAIVSHRFHPTEYGRAFAVFSFFTLLTQPAAGFSRMVAWSTSRELATTPGADHDSSTLLRSANRRLLLGGIILAVGFVATAPLLADFLNVPASYVVLGAVGVPFMLATPPLLGSLQGEQRFVPWSALSIGIALSRVVFVGVLAIPMGVPGVLLGISIAAAVLYAVSLAMVWPRLRRAGGRSDWRRVRRFLTVSVASTLAVSALLGSDVILVEHLFSRRQGGEFSAVAVTSRALFFGLGSVTSVLLPKVAARHARSRSTTGVVGVSLAIALIGGVAGLVIFSVAGHAILQSFAGRAYDAGASYIGWYALGMPLLAAVVMLSNTQQSLDRLTLLWVLVPAILLKPALIALFHDSLLTVVIANDVAIGAVLAALALLYVVQERALRRTEAERARLVPGGGDADLPVAPAIDA